MKKRNEIKSFNSNKKCLCSDERGYIVEEIISYEEKLQAFQLRHRIFCKELGWVKESDDKIEKDQYDEKATFVGVFDKNRSLKGFIRIIKSENYFMLENEFPFLVDKSHEVLKSYESAELSRLCIAPESRSDYLSANFGIHTLSMLLYKGVYHWSLRNNIRYLYLVVEQKIHRMLCAKGFMSRLVGEPVTMPDGIVAVAAQLDWRNFEEINIIKRKNMLEWISQYQPSPRKQQWPQREYGLQPQVFS